MGKIIFVSLLVIAVVLGASIILFPSQGEVQGDKISDNTFELAKEKVVTKPFEWAKGEGRPQGTVVTKGYIVVDTSGEVIFSLNPDTKQSPASLTKIMTAMVALDLSSLTQVLEVNQKATEMEPTTLRATLGEKFTVEELLKALLMYSANDSAEILAEGIGKSVGGDRELFVALMNEKAKSLKLSKTQFANPSGLDDPKQYSTPRELAIMAKYAIDNYPDIAEIIKMKDTTLVENNMHKKYDLVNWNALIDIYPGVVGVKIGHTDLSGHSTIVLSKRENQEMMVVLIGAPDRRARDLWTVELLNFAFSEKQIKPFRVTRDMLIGRSFEWSKKLYEQE